MHLYTINTGYFKLDGGAMFGVVPKSLWSRNCSPDDNNMCTWAMRSLLIQDGKRLILIDNGIGDKQDDNFFKHYYLHGQENIYSSLSRYGFNADDITDVFLTHLHFDHCGGSVKWNKDRSSYEMTFKNARYWTNKEHWQCATKPNYREKASFLKENILPIKEAGHLNFLPIDSDFSNNISVLFVSGHTESQMIPHINYKNKKIVFMADLLPSISHIPLPYIMSYDTQPLLTLKEKERFLIEAAKNDYVLFLQHDHLHECCTVKLTERGVKLDKTFKLKEII